MKAAISIPDEVFRAADALAERLGVSRSALYSKAIADFLRQHRDDSVTRLLNEVYAATPSTLDVDFGRLQRRAVKASR